MSFSVFKGSPKLIGVNVCDSVRACVHVLEMVSERAWTVSARVPDAQSDTHPRSAPSLQFHTSSVSKPSLISNFFFKL